MRTNKRRYLVSAPTVRSGHGYSCTATTEVPGHGQVRATATGIDKRTAKREALARLRAAVIRAGG